MLAFAQFGSDLDDSTKVILDHGAKVYELLKQEQYFSIAQEVQAIILVGVKERIINPLPVEYIHEYRDNVINWATHEEMGMGVFSRIHNTGKISDEDFLIIESALVKIVNDIIFTIPNYVKRMHKPMPSKYQEVE